MMFIRIIPLNSRMSIRDKARLNVCIAKDLAESFGGNKTVYLKALNRKLKIKIEAGYELCWSHLAKAA